VLTTTLKMSTAEQIWFEGASKVLEVFDFKREQAIIYKGFKLSKYLDGTFSIKDGRTDDEDYVGVNKEDLNKLEGKDFILGIDQISHKLTLEKIRDCTKKAEKFYSKRRKANREMQKDVRLNQKRIRNININIDILVDQIFLYQSRVNQFNNKYNE
jgi:hypothetical protein